MHNTPIRNAQRAQCANSHCTPHAMPCIAWCSNTLTCPQGWGRISHGRDCSTGGEGRGRSRSSNSSSSSRAWRSRHHRPFKSPTYAKITCTHGAVSIDSGLMFLVWSFGGGVFGVLPRVLQNQLPLPPPSTALSVCVFWGGREREFGCGSFFVLFYYNKKKTTATQRSQPDKANANIPLYYFNRSLVLFHGRGAW